MELKRKIYVPMLVYVCKVSTVFHLPKVMRFILNDKTLEK